MSPDFEYPYSIFKHKFIQQILEIILPYRTDYHLLRCFQAPLLSPLCLLIFQIARKFSHSNDSGKTQLISSGHMDASIESWTKRLHSSSFEQLILCFWLPSHREHLQQ